MEYIVHLILENNGKKMIISIYAPQQIQTKQSVRKHRMSNWLVIASVRSSSERWRVAFCVVAKVGSNLRVWLFENKTDNCKQAFLCFI